MENLIFGALAPKIDLRDYKVSAAAGIQFPESFALEDLPKVKNQGTVSSCVAHAASTILEYFNRREIQDSRQLSTDFIYGMQGIEFNRLEKGMYLRDACKIVQSYGDCYDVTIPSNTEQPRCTKLLQEILTDEIYQEASNMRIESYARCSSDDDIKYALMNYGPVLASIKWYKKYDIDKNEVIHMNTKSSLSHHAIVIYGWNEYGWLCRNSWGRTWNGNGNFVYPYDSKLNEAWSFVDAKNSDIKKPIRNRFIDFCYKVLNLVINFFKGR